jgi:hypothetical protein
MADFSRDIREQRSEDCGGEEVSSHRADLFHVTGCLLKQEFGERVSLLGIEESHEDVVDEVFIDCHLEVLLEYRLIAE